VGRPEAVPLGQRPEFTLRRLLGWAEDWKIGLVHSKGRPNRSHDLRSLIFVGPER
jgi:hypothetical protein